MGEVRYFEGGEPILEDGKNPECVEYLEQMLEKARSGEIVGVAIAMQYADGASSSGRAGFLFNQRVIGALMQQVVRLS